MHEYHPTAALGSGHPAVPDLDSALGGSPSPVDTYQSQIQHLAALRAEYHLTIKVVAVLAEQLLLQQNSNAYGELVITDEALLDCPELEAWRDEGHSQIHIKVTRR